MYLKYFGYIARKIDPIISGKIDGKNFESVPIDKTKAIIRTS